MKTYNSSNTYSLTNHTNSYYITSDDSTTQPKYVYEPHTYKTNTTTMTDYLNYMQASYSPEEILDSIDISIIEKYIRRKKLERINKK